MEILKRFGQNQANILIELILPTAHNSCNTLTFTVANDLKTFTTNILNNQLIEIINIQHSKDILKRLFSTTFYIITFLSYT